MAAPGMAPADATGAQPAAAQRPVALNGLDRVRRAGGQVTTRRRAPAAHALVQAHEADDGTGERAHRRGSLVAWSTSDMTACNSPNDRDAASAAAPTR